MTLSPLFAILSHIMIIAGLGNPGSEYEHTRHNAGFWAADAVAERYRVSFNNNKHRALFGFFSFKGREHVLVKPQTFMNLSGEAIAPILNDCGAASSELLVIADDINLPLGRLRLRSSGSDGGHNGLKSIISLIGSSFWRLRIGVGRPAQGVGSHEQLINHVLGSISQEEGEILGAVLASIPDLTALWLMGMGTRAMTKYNGADFLALVKKEHEHI